MVMDTTKAVLKLVGEERVSQDKKWGVQNNSNEKWMAILIKSVGEASKAGLAGDDERYMEKLVQCAAVAVAAIECTMRRIVNDG